ncbi:MAG: hypothetical protein AB3N20_02325 [Rhizobiaceae bacterium]
MARSSGTNSVAFTQIIVCAVVSIWLLMTLTLPADTRPGTCSTEALGQYPCEIILVEFNGSFAMSAPDKPTLTLILDAPGFAFGFIDEGHGRVVLPGIYMQEEDRPACWSNRQTGDRICAD